ncbi:uncharacterized protein RHIMIDRAFT_233752 [Rhizopus microsporus ATCC 52813]|uniref:Uncharacterized protein n=1 Tax=Rhizopus microsporus ATCC 52813 TaxID=1340429 RepID=A0A2G4T566_RHIZD|nr:uncharacterized protein RHIMIDRAFT_233752 [Rhizopus microsporus ATCC 52813]PHZ16152.1 hypothetical protein RHIMIDRAFT_233752 [Rhizopus microsporus ATCC 52813]
MVSDWGNTESLSLDQHKQVQGAFFAIRSRHEGSVFRCPNRTSKTARELEFDKQRLRRLLLPTKELAQMWVRYSQHCVWRSYQEHNHIRGRSGGNDNCGRHDPQWLCCRNKD